MPVCWSPRPRPPGRSVATGWLLDLLGLPPTAAIGYVTGGMMANFTCLAAARHEVSAGRLGRRGPRSPGALPLRVVVGGTPRDRRRLAALPRSRTGAQHRGRRRRAGSDAGGRPEGGAVHGDPGPTIVCLQAATYSGAFDPIDEAVEVAHGHGAGCMWTALGLWAAAAPSLRSLTAGIAGADLGHRRPQER